MCDVNDIAYVCRVCGIKNEKNQCLYDDLRRATTDYGDDNDDECVKNDIEFDLLAKLQTTFSIVVYDGDGLPRYICVDCTDTVEKYFQKIQQFNRLQRRWQQKLKEHDLTNHHMQVSKIVEIYSNKVKNRIEEITPKQSAIRKNNILSCRDRSSDILKNLLLNRHIYQVRSLQQLCLDFFNREGPKLLDTVLKIKEPLSSPTPDSFNEDDPDDYFMNAHQKSSKFITHQSSLGVDFLTDFNYINPYVIKKCKKKKKRNPLRDYITSRRKRKPKQVSILSGDTPTLPATVTREENQSKNREILFNSAIFIKQEPDEQKKMYKKRRRLDNWQINPASLHTELINNDLNKLLPTENGQHFIDETMSGKNQSHQTNKFVKNVSVNNVALGQESRNHPTRLSDQIHKKKVNKKYLKNVKAYESGTVRSISLGASDIDGISIKKSKTITPTITNIKIECSAKLSSTLSADLDTIETTIQETNSVILENSEAPVITVKKPPDSPDNTQSNPLYSNKKISLNDDTQDSSTLNSSSRLSDMNDDNDDSSDTPEIKAEDIIEKSKKYKMPTEYIKHIAKTKPRNKTRINYSEALVDEALMYEEILMDKEAKEQLVIATALEASKQTMSSNPKLCTGSKNEFCFDFAPNDLDKNSSCKKLTKTMNTNCSSANNNNNGIESRPKSLSEISITPISRPSQQKYDCAVNPIDVSDIKNTFKSHPEMVFNISSAVSIQLKSTTIKSIANSTADHSINDTATLQRYCTDDDRILQKCSHCGIILSNIHSLAIHQLTHLQISTYRIGGRQILDPKYRRGRMVPMGVQKCFRCLNCWRLHPNSQSILEHWVSGKCIFYCAICGESFHMNPKMLREHFPTVHGIKYKLPEEFLTRIIISGGGSGGAGNAAFINGIRKRNIQIKGATSSGSSSTKLKPIIQKSGRVTCEICSCSFPNMQSRNSHMRLHKNEKFVNRPFSNTLRFHAANAAASIMRPFPPGHHLNTMRPQGRHLFTGSNRPKPPNNVNSIRPSQMAGRSNQPPRIAINHTGNGRKHISNPSTAGGRIVATTSSHQSGQIQTPRNTTAGYYPHTQSHPHPATYKAEQPAYRQQQQIHSRVNQQHVPNGPSPAERHDSIDTFSSIDVKTELTDDDPYGEYNQSADDYNQSDYNNSADYSSDYMDDYNSGGMAPMQPEIIMNHHQTGTVKSEQPSTSIMPRLQVKKLHELQEPTYASTSSYPFSTNHHHQQHHPPPSVPLHHPQQSHHSHAANMAAHYQMAGGQHMLQSPSHSAAAHMQQSIQMHQQHHHHQQQQHHHHHQQSQFQINHQPPLQSPQYYNPAFLVQPPPGPSVPQHNMYQSYNRADPGNEMDYSKYYS